MSVSMTPGRQRADAGAMRLGGLVQRQAAVKCIHPALARSRPACEAIARRPRPDEILSTLRNGAAGAPALRGAQEGGGEQHGRFQPTRSARAWSAMSGALAQADSGAMRGITPALLISVALA